MKLFQSTPGQRNPWVMFFCEMMGTAVLVLAGLSLVIFTFGSGSPLAALLPSVRLRQVLTGFLFGCVGAVVTISRLGKESGAHINPAVTFGFWMMGKMKPSIAVGYILFQLGGALLGCLPLLAWGSMGRSVSFGATVPGTGYTVWAALAGEVVTSFCLAATLFIFISYRKIRRFTPGTIPFLYAIMVPLEAPISGTSTNPARSFGPAVISGEWSAWWIYWVGPLLGALASIVIFSFLFDKIEEARLYHFECDNRKLFREEVHADSTEVR
jgi:aquaporin Z